MHWVLFYLFFFLQAVLVCLFRSYSHRVFFPHDEITARFLAWTKKVVLATLYCLHMTQELERTPRLAHCIFPNLETWAVLSITAFSSPHWGTSCEKPTLWWHILGSPSLLNQGAGVEDEIRCLWWSRRSRANSIDDSWLRMGKEPFQRGKLD